MGEKAFLWMEKKEDILKEVALKLKTSEDKILPRIEEVQEGLIKLKKKFEKQQQQVIEGKIEELAGRAVSVNYHALKDVAC